MVKIERRLGRKIQEDPDLRPDLPELVLPPVTIEEHARERCGACDPCKAQHCGRCKAWSTPHPYPPSSGGASSTVSKATAKNLLRGVEKLADHEERMTEATTKVLAVVSEAGGGPWVADAGLMETDLIVWLGVQQDRVKDLKEKIIRREREIARLA